MRKCKLKRGIIITAAVFLFTLCIAVSPVVASESLSISSGSATIALCNNFVIENNEQFKVNAEISNLKVDDFGEKLSLKVDGLNDILKDIKCKSLTMKITSTGIDESKSSIAVSTGFIPVTLGDFAQLSKGVSITSDTEILGIKLLGLLNDLTSVTFDVVPSSSDLSIRLDVITKVETGASISPIITLKISDVSQLKSIPKLDLSLTSGTNKLEKSYLLVRSGGGGGGGGGSVVIPTVTPTPTGSGFDKLVVNPSGALVPGENVTATVEVKLPKGAATAASKVVLDTALVGDSWTVDIIKAGTIVCTKHPADPYSYISGFDLEYDTDLLLRVSVTGVVSSESAGKDISVLQITKSGMYDGYAQSYSSPKQFVYNPANLNGELAVLENAITTLDTRIAAYLTYGHDVSKAQSYTEQARSKYTAAQNAGIADAITAFSNIEAGNKLVKQAQMELALCALSMSLSYTSAVDETITTLYSKGWNTEAKLLDTKNAGLKNIYSQLLSVYNTGNVPDAAALDQLAADSLALWQEGNSYLETSHLTTLKLSPGWNFISVPTKLAAAYDTAAELFAGVNTDDKAILSYKAESKQWKQVSSSTVIEPLDAYWIYSIEEKILTPEYDRGVHTPGMKTLKKGWNAIGLSAEKPMPAVIAFNGLNWRTYFSWNAAGQKYDNPVIKGLNGTYGEEKSVSLYKGGWIYMEEDGTYLGYA